MNYNDVKPLQQSEEEIMRIVNEAKLPVPKVTSSFEDASFVLEEMEFDRQGENGGNFFYAI